MTKMNASELDNFLRSHFTQSDAPFAKVETVGNMTSRVRLPYHDRHLRPGETISGPALMTLADTAVYVALLAMIGPVALAVTTSFSINFLRKPAAKDVIAECSLLKLGRRLAVGDVKMFSEGEDEIVAQATVTYSIPPTRE